MDHYLNTALKGFIRKAFTGIFHFVKNLDLLAY